MGRTNRLRSFMDQLLGETMFNRTRTRTVRAIISVGAALALSTQLLSPATAAAPPPPDPGRTNASAHVRPGLQPCVDLALKQKAQQWVCNAEGLTVLKDAAGKAANTFTAKKSTDFTAKVAAPLALAADDYDYWCEFGTVCNRKISKYIAETKGNAAYGNQNGAIGSYDAILRTNLNGRQGQWRATVIWDSGPRLTFSSTQVQCVESSWFPIVCGNHGLPNATVTTVSSGWRHDYGVIYGNRLKNADPYHGAFQTMFTPSGYPAYRAANLAGMSFTCPSGSGNCYFP